MKNIPLLVGTIIGTVLLVVGIAVFFSQGSSPGTTAQPIDQAMFMTEGSHVAGATESAKVVVTEFSDFQCPACRAAKPLVDQLLAQYGSDVQIIYKHFPLDEIHPNARHAAYASEVAAGEGKFWEMHDLLFDTQDEWSTITNRDELKEYFAGLADQLGIDKETFLVKIEDEAIQQKVQADVNIGNQAGVNATPTFYVDGTPTPAPQLLTTVASIVQSTDAQSETTQ